MIRTWGTPRRITRDLCVVECVNERLRRVYVYVPFRETMEPNLTAAVNAALDRIPPPIDNRRG